MNSIFTRRHGLAGFAVGLSLVALAAAAHAQPQPAAPSDADYMAK